MPKKNETPDASNLITKELQFSATSTEPTVSIVPAPAVSPVESAKAAYESARSKAETAREIAADAASFFSKAEAAYNQALHANAPQETLIDLLTKRDKARYGVTAAQDRFTMLNASADQAESTYQAALRKATIDQLNVEAVAYQQELGLNQESWRNYIKQEFLTLQSALPQNVVAALFTKPPHNGKVQFETSPVISADAIIGYYNRIAALTQRAVELNNRARNVGDQQWAVPLPVFVTPWQVWEEFITNRSITPTTVNASIESVTPSAPAPLSGSVSDIFNK